ncbi:pentapeptide repeat-containing protein [Dickeya dianthicola]|uniref:pentapeptide repeat-containing protein n=1 Tax=Dickeya dianthicola TaxID=204039 RepID=UPI001867DE66|nr:pentapeptide repeat-containing protein [Dickeya dianthicola]
MPSKSRSIFSVCRRPTVVCYVQHSAERMKQKLQRSNLYRSNLRRSNLRRSNLRRSNLHRSNSHRPNNNDKGRHEAD